MVDCGSGQGRSVLATASGAALRRGMQIYENAAMGRKMPFMDGHYIIPSFGVVNRGPIQPQSIGQKNQG